VTLGLSLLAHNLASPYLGREPKARVATFGVTSLNNALYEKHNFHEF
jgi:hypothetical protein